MIISCSSPRNTILSPGVQSTGGGEEHTCKNFQLQWIWPSALVLGGKTWAQPPQQFSDTMGLARRDFAALQSSRSLLLPANTAACWHLILSDSIHGRYVLLVGASWPNWTLCFPCMPYLLLPRAPQHPRREEDVADSSPADETATECFPAYSIFTWDCPSLAAFVSSAITEESCTLDTFCS